MTTRRDTILEIGEGDSMHYLQLLYDKETLRNMDYGHELQFFPVTGSPAQGFATAPREPSNYVLYRAKGTHYTGKKVFLSQEKLPTVELVLRAPTGESLESIIRVETLKIGQRREVSKAELIMAAVSRNKHRLERLKSDLGRFSDKETLSIDVSEIVDSGHWANDLLQPSWIEYELDATIQGPILSVLGIYDFLQKAGLKYGNLAIAFS